MIKGYLKYLSFSSFICISLGSSYLLFRSRMFKKMFRSFYKQKYNEEIINSRIINDVEECLSAVNDLKERCVKDRVLGLDCEWRSDNSTTKKVALLQLASNDGFCSLFRLCNIGHVPQCLSDLLSDESIIKTGVAVSNDARKLYNDYGVLCKSCIDLRHMAKHVGLDAAGLGKMSELYLDVELDKGWRIRCSDWEAEVLSEKQVNYAAKDALMSVYLFEYFNYKYINETYPLRRRMLWTDEYFWYKTRECWVKYFDLGFNEKSFSSYQNKHKPDKDGEILSDMCDFESLRKKISTQPSKNNNNKQFSNSNEVLKRSPIYHNAVILAPDGMVLCTCSTRKADWYLSRGMADHVSDNPLTVRLNFEPSGRAGGGDGYYGRPKKNICVVCGSSESLRRKNIVPHEYRKYFPVEIKEHSSHDVLLFCNNCHSKSQFHDQQLKNMLIKQCDAPVTIANKITTYGSCQAIELPEMHRIRSASKALLRFRDTLPEAKRKELESTIMNYLKNNDDIIRFHSNNLSNPIELNDDLLEKLYSFETWLQIEKHIPHGMKVVDYYKVNGEDGIHSLEQIWRNHFIKNMAPKFLPDLWSIDYNHAKLE